MLQPSPFSPLHPVRATFADYDRPMWITGGWALSLHVSRRLRVHSDIDVLILAEDVEYLREVFGDTTLLLQTPNTGERRAWAPGTELMAGRDALVFAEPDEKATGLQILLAKSEGDDWVFHRGNGSSRKPIAEITLTTSDGIGYLAPEIVLLLKSRQLRDKDTQDFLALAPVLGDARKSWLLEHVEGFDPDHPWLPVLKGSQD
ncbi:aminoglycoside-2''-adenylyltransferase [Stackebrandtia endophytica]|uniref:Aminoglycoside-2''-adenylyltransferase n=1 Tax=Stackebrandtia endophytica TaxID=1496996 RepID=A0A543B123_9ACTN|nr:amino acid transporter [Stackebrandtia endophytica]TQL78496.1 aminoglycoside-2''-adenylyltransferase [Stackebrandtia endophytica]